MARIGYYTYKKENKTSGAVKYGVRLKSYSTMSKSDCKKYAMGIAKVTGGEMDRGFAALGQAISEFVLNGHSITIDGLGCFTLSTKTGIWNEQQQKWVSAGQTSMDQVDASQIKGLYLRFRPCKELRAELKNAEFFNINDSGLGNNGLGKNVKEYVSASGQGSQNP